MTILETYKYVQKGGLETQGGDTIRQMFTVD